MTGPVSLLKAVRLTRLLSPCCAESVNSILHGASSLGGLQQKRTIINKTLLHLPDDYPDPWPYQERGIIETRSSFVNFFIFLWRSDFSEDSICEVSTQDSVQMLSHIETCKPGNHAILAISIFGGI
ncbi:hypothetical protein AB6A40_009880 [Gnathostoma spinigerum]|uniref:Uncharacterized protein n=1 Tax=Gnathostoma spinigerum TaxID=75299 RepID=A0ABD6F008_9BILA